MRKHSAANLDSSQCNDQCNDDDKDGHFAVNVRALADSPKRLALYLCGERWIERGGCHAVAATCATMASWAPLLSMVATPPQSSDTIATRQDRTRKRARKCERLRLPPSCVFFFFLVFFVFSERGIVREQQTSAEKERKKRTGLLSTSQVQSVRALVSSAASVANNKVVCKQVAAAAATQLKSLAAQQSSFRVLQPASLAAPRLRSSEASEPAQSSSAFGRRCVSHS